MYFRDLEVKQMVQIVMKDLERDFDVAVKRSSVALVSPRARQVLEPLENIC